MITTILFDLGETLVYLDKPTDEIVNARLHSLHSVLRNDGFDLQYPDLDGVYRVVHSELSSFSRETLIETTTPRILEEVLARLGISCIRPRAIQDLVHDFYEPEIRSWTLYNDTLSVLSSLRDQGFSLGLISNARSDWAVNEIMRRLRIHHFFHTIVTSARFGLRKPRPEIYFKAMRNLGSNHQSTIMVGNNLVADILGAKKANTGAVYLEREYSSEKHVKPDAAAKSLSEIVNIIKEWNDS